MTGLILLAHTGLCQSAKDTTAMVKEFNKVMSFAVQPFLYYTTSTKMDAVPVLESRDTMTVSGVFYKMGTNLYYNNGVEETLLEDSLLVQINNDRKTIWISRADMDTREKINVSPLGNKKTQELFRKNYAITKTIMGDGLARMNFEMKQTGEGNVGVTTIIGLEYDTRSYLPFRMEMDLQMREPANDEIITALRSEGITDTRLVEITGTQKYIVRKQKMSVSFSGIDSSKEKASGMPSWKDKLNYDPQSGEFVGKGIYQGYEIVKTF